MNTIIVEHNGHLFEVVPYTKADVQARVESFNRRERSQPEYDDRERERIRETKAFVAKGVHYLRLYQSTVGSLVDVEV